MYHPTPPNCPPEFINAVWTDLDDPSALERGNIVYDPCEKAFGRIMTFFQGEFVIRWFRQKKVRIPSFTPEHLIAAKMWWIDPCEQEQS